MKILKHKNIEFSEIYLSELDEDMRIDPEYYQPVFIEKYNKISNHKNIFKLNKLADITDGEHGSPDLDENSGIKYLSGHNVKDNFIDLSDIRYCSAQLHNKNLRSSIRKGNVLLSIVGTVGNASVIHNQFLGNTDRNVATIKNIDSCLNPYYLSTFLNSSYGKFQTERFSTGNVQALLNLLQIKKIIIPIPSETLQKTIQKLIEEAQKQKELSEKIYKEAEQILLSKLGLENWQPKTIKFKLHGVEFEVEDTVNNINSIEIFRTDRIDAEYWNPKYDEFSEMLNRNKSLFFTLGELVTWVKGIEIGSQEYLDEGTYPFIRVSNITNKGFDFTSAKYVKHDTFEKLENYQIKKGEILLSKDGTAGIAYLVRDDITGIQSSGILRLTNISKLPSEYIELVLNSPIVQIQIQRKMSGALIQHLKVTEAVKFIIPKIPSIKKVSKKVNASFESRKLSKNLLEISKRAVEIFIEETEEKAIEFINNSGVENEI